MTITKEQNIHVKDLQDRIMKKKNKKTNINFIDKAIKLSVIAGVLLISFSFFYYFVIYLPQKEQTRIELQEKEQLNRKLEQLKTEAGLELQKRKQLVAEEALDLQKQEQSDALQNCLWEASNEYHDRWSRECKAMGRLTSDCISFLEMTFGEYAEQNNIPRDDRDKINEGIENFYKERLECSCALPFANGDRIEEALENNKNECFKRYTQK